MKTAKIYQFPKVEIEQSDATSELEKQLARYLDLKDILSNLTPEYNALKKKLKEFFEGMPESYIGEYKITGKYRDMPAKEIGAYKWWDIKVRKI